MFEISLNIFIPRFFLLCIIFNPYLTRGLLNPTRGTTSQIVAKATKSRNSKNVICALHYAKKRWVKVFFFLGSGGDKALELSDEAFILPSDGIGRIQGSHNTAGHALWNILKII